MWSWVKKDKYLLTQLLHYGSKSDHNPDQTSPGNEYKKQLTRLKYRPHLDHIGKKLRKSQNIDWSKHCTITVLSCDSNQICSNFWNRTRSFRDWKTYQIYILHIPAYWHSIEDVTTISKPQSLTSMKIQDYTMRVSSKTTTLFLSEQ